MALMIELNGYVQQQKKTQSKRNIGADKLTNILLTLKKSLCLGGTQTISLISLDKEQRQNRTELMFTTKVDNSSELLYRFVINRSLNIKSEITLFQKGNYVRARSSQIKKNINKIVAFINSLTMKKQVFLMLNPYTTQFHFLQSYYLGCTQPKQLILQNLKFLIIQSLSFAKSFTSLLLYKSNLINKYTLLSRCSQQIRSYFIGQNGQYSALSTIREELSLSNCKISSSIQEIKSDKNQQRDFNQNLNKVVDLYNHRTYPPEVILFSETSTFRTARKSKLDTDYLNESVCSYKPKKCNNFDNNYLFSTIFIQQSENSNKQMCIAESSKAKIIYFRAKVKYGLTCPNNDFVNNSQSQEIQTQQSNQSLLDITSSKTIDKALVVKTPKQDLPLNIKNKVQQMLIYEKAIIRCLRGAQCVYLPKYYQASQKNSRYKDLLMIDHVQGVTLSDVISSKNLTLTLSWKMHLLMHLANALRFLENYDIAHLDLSANNIILTSQGLPKIIDFGQSYHQQVLMKIQKNKKATTYKHKAGRTFPFAPPETTQRSWKFNSKQDIYSLGVIAFRLVMGYFPNLCTEQKMEQLYMQKTYNQRLYFSPEGLEWVGQYQVVLSCMQLVINCMHINQYVRPNPSWTHILFKKMFELVEKFS